MDNKLENMGHIIAVREQLELIVASHMECIVAAKEISFAKDEGEAMTHLTRSSEEIKNLGERYLVLFNILKQHREE